MFVPLSFICRRHGSFFFSSRSAHATSFSFPSLDVTNPTYMIYSSNTSLGKTLISTGIAHSFLSSSYLSNSTFLYLKPLQTGFPSDSDSNFVFRKVSELFRLRSIENRSLFASNHTINASLAAKKYVLGSVDDKEEEKKRFCSYEEVRVGSEDATLRSRLMCKTGFGWNAAVSPHLAVEREGMKVSDAELREMVGKCLGNCIGEEGKEEVWRVVETAGGVASPGASGTLQCDLYRPFRLPVILVGDGKLGGISSTISAYESLKIRGYDVIAIVLADAGLSNDVPLTAYLRKSVDVLVLPSIPEDPSNNLFEWFQESSKVFGSLREIMLASHLNKMQRLHDMRRKAESIFWWPFTQHKLIHEHTVTVIDSRHGFK